MAWEREMSTTLHLEYGIFYLFTSSAAQALKIIGKEFQDL